MENPPRVRVRGRFLDRRLTGRQAPIAWDVPSLVAPRGAPGPGDDPDAASALADGLGQVQLGHPLRAGARPPHRRWTPTRRATGCVQAKLGGAIGGRDQLWPTAARAGGRRRRWPGASLACSSVLTGHRPTTVSGSGAGLGLGVVAGGRLAVCRGGPAGGRGRGSLDLGRGCGGRWVARPLAARHGQGDKAQGQRDEGPDRSHGNLLAGAATTITLAGHSADADRPRPCSRLVSFERRGSTRRRRPRSLPQVHTTQTAATTSPLPGATSPALPGPESGRPARRPTPGG